MSSVALDHLVVAADSLQAGVAWCEATLGVTPGPGGRHALFGTHNRLLKISSAPFLDSYLEIIAIDRDAQAPARPRWFGLDTLDLSAGPRLLNLVARSTMLDMHRWGLITVGLKPGDPVAASRETPQGSLSWQILVREDGQLNAGGALPTLIQWAGQHPTAHMPDSGVTLQALALHGVPPRAAEVLRLRGVQIDNDTAGPALVARLATPRGEVILSSP